MRGGAAAIHWTEVVSTVEEQQSHPVHTVTVSAHHYHCDTHVVGVSFHLTVFLTVKGYPRLRHATPPASTSTSTSTLQPAGAAEQAAVAINLSICLSVYHDYLTMYLTIYIYLSRIPSCFYMVKAKTILPGVQQDSIHQTQNINILNI